MSGRPAPRRSRARALRAPWLLLALPLLACPGEPPGDDDVTGDDDATGDDDELARTLLVEIVEGRTAGADDRHAYAAVHNPWYGDGERLEVMAVQQVGCSY